jgi:hypothetical protein
MASSKIRGRETPRFLTPRASSLRQRRRLGEIRTSELARVTDLSTAFISLVERGHRRLSDKRYDQLRRGLEFLEHERQQTADAAFVPPTPLLPPEAGPNEPARNSAVQEESRPATHEPGKVGGQ